MTKDIPTPAMLRKLLRYEPATGKLFWRMRTVDMFDSGKYHAARLCLTWNARNAGAEAFTATSAYGYKRGCVALYGCLSHRVIWAIVHGEWPPKDIDHIDGNSGNNRIGNLRCVSHVENMKNMKKHMTNTSGVMGVCWDKNRSMWVARIHDAGKKIHIGRFTHKSDAIAARAAAEIEYGYHANHGRTEPP